MPSTHRFAGAPTSSPRSAFTRYVSGLTRLITCSHPGMISMGYNAFEAKNSGIVISWPMPISRSRVWAMPAMAIDRQAKNPALSISAIPAPSSFSGLTVIDTPSSSATGTSTTTGDSPRSPAEIALASTIAARGVGVTMTLVRMPASRSQMIWIP